MGKVFKDKPLAEITLRKFERPHNEQPDLLLKKLCISLGLLQPGDSRDVVVDILKLLLNNRKTKLISTSIEIEASLKNSRNSGVAGSNIRRQLLRLEKVGLVEKWDSGYRIREFLPLDVILTSYVKPFLIDPTFSRINDYAREIDKNL